jgi:hypothetical protein
MAWQYISPEVIVSVCKKFCMCSAVDGTDGDVLRNESEDGNSDTDW